ncbi:hypothetical protein [Natrinema sp. 1APR25-10V2]|uniref:DUF7266 family protein n=1 Tax=Natrinema sp. 1APR25-10V2 TaxID=2951081 RepID=UPI0028742E32|nr:hypothetical protein [Natrinema sp. 1APR25-10V2]MDS0474133.1 hypothetical protein [Natrinema sp. 1APR25-10V2]
MRAMIHRSTERDRAVSISITHVLTLGITTILIAMLVTSAGTMLETETSRSTESSLETIGERLADEIGNVDQIGSGAENVTLTTEHPRTVAGSRYTVELLESGDCAESPLLDGSTDCVKLTADGADTVVYVPIKTETDIDYGSSASGGTITIVYESSEISIEDGT